MQETDAHLNQQGLPGELERLRSALLTDQQGLLTATRRRLARLAQARGVELHAIEDVVQETLLEAWSHLERLRSPEGFHPWIDEICRNICRRAARRREMDQLRRASLAGPYQNGAASPDEDAGTSLSMILDPTTPDPLEELTRQERTTLLDRALGLLPPGTRQVVEMCYLLEMPHSEVAAWLGITPGTLDTRLHRARRQLRQVLSGPLQQEAVAFDLLLEADNTDGWAETRLWCSSCGRCRLQGSFIECEGGVNLHVRCPGCAQNCGLDTVHSMGLVSLHRMKSFRPAWKRTMQGLSDLVLQGLNQRKPLCPWCGSLTSLQVADAEAVEEDTPLVGPHRFWIRWACANCGGLVASPGDLPPVDQTVFWSHPQSRQFMAQHPRWLSTTSMPVEHAGQPTLCFQLKDMTSTVCLAVLAHRYTLEVLAVY